MIRSCILEAAKALAATKKKDAAVFVHADSIYAFGFEGGNSKAVIEGMTKLLEKAEAEKWPIFVVSKPGLSERERIGWSDDDRHLRNTPLGNNGEGSHITAGPSEAALKRAANKIANELGDPKSYRIHLAGIWYGPTGCASAVGDGLRARGYEVVPEEAALGHEIGTLYQTAQDAPGSTTLGNRE